MSTTPRTGPGRPLSVLFAPAHTLVDDRFGSDYYWAYQIVERLALDHGVRIIALTVQPPARALPGVRFVSVDPGGAIPVSPIDSLRFHLRSYAKAREILRGEEHIDVVHHMLPFGFRTTFNPLALLPRRGDPPIVIGPLQSPYLHRGEEWDVTAQGALPQHPETPPVPSRPRRTLPPLSTFITTPTLSTLSAQTLRRAAAVVAVSEYAARRFRSYAGITGVSIIPPGVDTDVFYPPTVDERTRRWQEERPVTIVGCGRLTQRKGFDVVVRAVANLLQADAPVRLRLIGDGPLRTSLETLAHELGIAHAVTFVGNVPHDDSAREYRRADIFCSASRGEGFATVSLEALASGLPIVATPAGGFREVIGRHGVGALTPFDDVDRLTTALAHLVADNRRRTELGQQAREIAVREFDWRVIAARYVALYHGLIRLKR